MAVATPADVEELLKHDREERLLGERERSWLDFKRSPYLLKTERAKVELAKDVAAIANSGGGCIVVGVATRKAANDIDEVAEAITPVPRHMIDAAQYHAILDNLIYPPVDGVRIEAYPRGEKCLALIVVPPQDNDNRPYLLRRQVGTDDKPIDAISLPSRSGSQTRWAPVGVIHRDMSDGRRSRSEPPDGWSPEKHDATRTEAFEARVRARASEIEQFMEWQDRAFYLLSASPRHQPQHVKGLYDPDDLLGAMARPPELRDAGFGIGWASQPRIEDGSVVAFDPSRCRWLDPDGFFTVALVADQDMLARAPRPSAYPRRLTVHPLAVVEFTYEYCRFLADQLIPRVDNDWDLCVFVLGAKSRPWSLQLGHGSAFDHFPDARPAVTDDWLKIVRWSEDAARTAHQLLVQLYELFGQPDTTIPYIQEGRVDADAIIAQSKR